MADARIVLSASDKTRAAFASAKANMQGFAKSAGGAVAAVTGLGAAALAASQAIKIKGAIDELDRLDDLSEKYGIAAKSLSAYSYATQVAGTETEAFVTGLSKLSKNAAAAAGGDKSLQQVFRTLGVTVTDATGALRGADDLLGDIADRFSGYADGTAKAALAQEVFGRTGAAMIPLLNKGRDGIEALRREAEQLGLVYGDDVAKAAGDLNDNLKKLELASQAIYAQWAGDLIPKALELTNALIEATKNGDLLSTVLERMKGNAGFSSFGIANKQARQLSMELARAADRVEEFTEASRKNPYNEAYKRRLAEVTADYQRLSKEAAAASEHAKKLLEFAKPVTAGAGRGFVNPPLVTPAARTAPPVVNRQAATDAEKAATAYAGLIAQIRERISLNEAEIAGGRKLTDEERFAIDVVNKLADSETKFTAAQKRAVTASLDTLIVRARANDQARESAALLQAESRALAAAAAARADDNARLREHVDEIGLSIDQLEQLRISRAQQRVALEEERIATLKLFGAEQQLIEQRELLLDAERESIELMRRAAAERKAIAEDETRGAKAGAQDYLDDIAKKGDATRAAVSSAARALEDDLVESFKAGKLNVRSFIDTVISEFLRLKVVRPLMDSLFKNIPSFDFGGGGGGGAGSFADSPFQAIGLASGTNFVPFDGMPAVLHKGEAVVPAEYNPAAGGRAQAPVFDFSGMQINVGQGVSRSEMDATLRARNAEIEARIRRLAAQGALG